MTRTEDLLGAFENTRQALLSNDVVALTRLLADDYCGVDPSGGKQDRAMLLQAYSPGGVQLRTYQTSFEHTLRFLDVYVHSGSTWLLSVSQVTELGRGK